MSKISEPTPGAFSNSVVDAIRDVMGNRAVLSLTKEFEGRKPVNRSSNYLAERFRKTKSFTLTDIEEICAHLDIPLDLLFDTVAKQPTFVEAPMSVVADNVTDISSWGADRIDGEKRKAALTDEEMDTDEN